MRLTGAGLLAFAIRFAFRIAAFVSKVTAWSKQWEWADRARACDEEIDRHVRAAYLDEAKRMARIQAQEARAACAVNMTFVGKFLARVRAPEEQERLDSVPIEELGIGYEGGE